MPDYARRAELEAQMNANRERANAALDARAQRIVRQIANDPPRRAPSREPTDAEWDRMTVSERVRYAQMKAKGESWPPAKREDFTPPTAAEIKRDIKAGRPHRRRKPGTIPADTPLDKTGGYR